MSTLCVAKLVKATYYVAHCTRGEMDIITDFGSVVPGSSPGGCTMKKSANWRFSSVKISL